MTKLPTLSVLALSLVFSVISSAPVQGCEDMSSCTIYPDTVVVNSNAYVHGTVYAGPSSTSEMASDHVTSHIGNFDIVEAGTKDFKIDHPSDPANKYLYHSSVESPDMKDIYDGVITLDTAGTAWVHLPSWFSDLNGDFRYQLTAIGKPATGLYVAEEISDNRFKVAGGAPNLRVSWQVTGIRHDATARAHRHPIEVEKASAERGRYLDPVAFNQPAESSLRLANRPAPRAAVKAQVQRPKAAEPQTKTSQMVLPVAFGFASVFGAGLFVRRRQKRG